MQVLTLQDREWLVVAHVSVYCRCIVYQGALSPVTVSAIVKEVTDGVSKHKHMVLHRRHEVYEHESNLTQRGRQKEALLCSKIVVGITVCSTVWENEFQLRVLFNVVLLRFQLLLSVACSP